MSNQLLASKNVIYEEPPKVRGIKTTSTSEAGAIGIAERGPIGEAVSCTSLEDVQETFGGFTQNSDLATGLMGLFKNGKTLVWVVRTVHYTNPADPATATAVRSLGHLVTQGVPSPAVVISANAGPFRLKHGDQLALMEGGNPEDVVTFEATAARVVAGGPGPYVLVDGQTLLVELEDGVEQTIIFEASAFSDIGAATADEVVRAINVQLRAGKALTEAGVPVIASDGEGTASHTHVAGGTANSALGFPTAPVQGTGNVARIIAVTIEEVKALVEALVPEVIVSGEPGNKLGMRTVAVGASASLQVGAATAAAFGLDNDLHQGGDTGTLDVLRVEGKDPGAYADRIEVQVKPPTSGETGFFNLRIIEDGVDRPGFANVCMNPDHSRYVVSVVNDKRQGSNLVHLVDLIGDGSRVPNEQTIQLAGGDDGLNGLDDNDFIGSKTGKTGLHALNAVQNLSLLIVPGRATSAMHNAMLQYCEVERDGRVFTILDPPEAYSAVEIVDYVKNVASIQGLSENGAIYWPRVKIPNPSKTVFGSAEEIVVPPSGFVCGAYARTDGARPGGVYDPPAGDEKGKLFGVSGFETDEVLEESYRDLVYPERINPLTTEPGSPRYIDGSRTLKGDGQFPYVAEKRGVIFISRSLKLGLKLRHRNNDERLRAEARRTIRAFLIGQMNVGAFRYRDPERAFLIEISDKAVDVMANKLVGKVSLATPKATDWVVIGISQDTRDLEEELAG